MTPDDPPLQSYDDRQRDAKRAVCPFESLSKSC